MQGCVMIVRGEAGGLVLRHLPYEGTHLAKNGEEVASANLRPERVRAFIRVEGEERTRILAHRDLFLTLFWWGRSVHCRRSGL